MSSSGCACKRHSWLSTRGGSDGPAILFSRVIYPVGVRTSQQWGTGPFNPHSMNSDATAVGRASSGILGDLQHSQHIILPCCDNENAASQDTIIRNVSERGKAVPIWRRTFDKTHNLCRFVGGWLDGIRSFSGLLHPHRSLKKWFGGAEKRPGARRSAAQADQERDRTIKAGVDPVLVPGSGAGLHSTDHFCIACIFLYLCMQSTMQFDEGPLAISDIDQEITCQFSMLKTTQKN